MLVKILSCGREMVALGVAIAAENWHVKTSIGCSSRAMAGQIIEKLTIIKTYPFACTRIAESRLSSESSTNNLMNPPRIDMAISIMAGIDSMAVVCNQRIAKC